MTLILDTTILVELESGNSSVIEHLKRSRLKHPDDLAITFATFSEFYYGALNRSKNKQNETLEWLRTFKLLNTTENSARLFAEIKRSLESNGAMIPLFDILIASIVIDNGATLATTDPHFKNVKGLSIESIKGETID
jgi:Predicted nucleic acid-binding protein, contains PIN domain